MLSNRPTFELPPQYEAINGSQPDERGQEMAECANVWRVYNEEASKVDARLVEGCNRNIDVLLVFTGLFSAVLTTFVVQSYSIAGPSSGDNVDILITHLIKMQPNFNSTEFATTLASTSNHSIQQIDLVNGFWFSALACSLSAALVSMLAKQWLYALCLQNSGTPLVSARERQKRHMCFKSWHVLTVINSLPMLLHLALLLFFMGLVILLRPLHVAITVSTTVIVGLVFTFYIGSIWYSMIDPECPYQHPISSQLRSFFWTEIPLERDPERPFTDGQAPTSKFIECSKTPVTPEDALDAGILVWMMNRPNRAVVVSALQAMAALPRGFTATHLLQEAGALPLLYREFQNCFQKDSSLEVQWKVVEPIAAERYCRSSMRHGSKRFHHPEFRQPLRELLTLPGYPDLNAIATCLWAMTSLNDHRTQLDIIRHLEDFIAGRTNLSQETELCLIHTLTECSFNWELSIAQITHIKRAATPVLLRRLFFHQASIEPSVRSAITVALSSLTGGVKRALLFTTEESQQESYIQLIIPALSAIIHDPSRYGVEDELLDKTACQVTRLASPIFGQVERFKPGLKSLSRQSLSKLFLDGRINAGNTPHDALTDVLQMLYPPTISVGQSPLFVTTLLETLSQAGANVGVVTSTIRLLDALLQGCPLAVAETFIIEDGINILLRTATTGATDSRKLELDCLRPLFTLIDSLAKVWHIKCKTTPDIHCQHCHSIDLLFQSNFFQSVTALVSAPRWWSPDVPDFWLPTLMKLCQTRPLGPEWPGVIAAFQKFADNNEPNDQIPKMISDIDVMRGLHEGRLIVS